MNEINEGLKVAMLGTTDGDFIDPNSDIPAGEMFRLAAEYLDAVTPGLVRSAKAEAWDEGLKRGIARGVADERSILSSIVNPYREQS